MLSIATNILKTNLSGIWLKTALSLNPIPPCSNFINKMIWDEYSTGHHWCLAPLISRIYETLLTWSELWWENLAAHTNSNFKLLKLREEQRFFKFAFWVRNILPRGLIGLLTKMATNFFGHLSHFFEIAFCGLGAQRREWETNNCRLSIAAPAAQTWSKNCLCNLPPQRYIHYITLLTWEL